MKIHGIEKVTLLDFPGKVACTVFLGGCDFRCPFCHNSALLDGTAPPILDEAAFLAFLKKRKNLLDGVCITGGEPLLRQDLQALLEQVKALGYQVKLDTNGNHPDRLRDLVEAGLVDYVAMDIKNSPSRYAQTVGLQGFDVKQVQESVSFLLSGAVSYEFRTTVVAEFHDEESFYDIGQWVQGAARYYLQPFVDRESVLCAGLHAPAIAALERYAAILKQYISPVEIRGI